MKKYGLIGKSLSHSFSKKYFSNKFERENIDARYELFETDEISSISALFESKGLHGANVTIPYKEKVIQFLDGVSESAQKIGAVNTIVREGKRLVGYNSDYYGFKESLLNFIGSEKVTALVLGTGGASKAVQQALKDLNITFNIVSRGNAHHFNYSELNSGIIKSSRLVINTTPLGMAPAIETFPDIPYEGITKNHFCYDLVYNPAQTQFLKKAHHRGAKTLNGLDMLHLQAEKSWGLWNR